MAIKMLAVVGFVALLFFGLSQLRSNQAKRDAVQRGRVAVAIENAKAAGKQEVNLPAPIPMYAEVQTLDEALANYTTVVAKPVLKHSQINADLKEIETWYKLEVIDFLSQPKVAKCTNCSFAKSIPPELQPVQPNEVVVVKNTGSLVLEGVKVTTSDHMFPDFKMNQNYLLFLSLDLNTRVGLIDLGQAGVLVVESDGQVAPVSGKSSRLNTELKMRFGKIDKIKTELQHRRFPS